jgi:hypothetical protein
MRGVKILLASIALATVAGRAQAALLSPEAFDPARFLPRKWPI